MHEYQFTLIRHTCTTIREHARENGNSGGNAAGPLAPVLGEVQTLRSRVDGFIKDFPRRVYVKKGLSYRRMAIAFLLYLATLGGALWFFQAFSLVDGPMAEEIAKILFRNDPDPAAQGRLLYWGFTVLFALLAMAVSFLGVMVLCLFMSIFRLPWINSVFEAVCTAFGTAACLYFYSSYLPLLQEQLRKIFS